MTGKNGWWCCCAAGCWIVHYDFNVSNTTTVSGWTEVVGDWGIEGWHLVEKYGT